MAKKLTPERKQEVLDELTAIRAFFIQCEMVYDELQERVESSDGMETATASEIIRKAMYDGFALANKATNRAMNLEAELDAEAVWND